MTPDVRKDGRTKSRKSAGSLSREEISCGELHLASKWHTNPSVWKRMKEKVESERRIPIKSGCELDPDQECILEEMHIGKGESPSLHLIISHLARLPRRQTCGLFCPHARPSSKSSQTTSGRMSSRLGLAKPTDCRRRSLEGGLRLGRRCQARPSSKV